MPHSKGNLELSLKEPALILISSLSFFLVGMFLTFVAYKLSFFSYQKTNTGPLVTFKNVISAFFLFLFIQIFLIPASLSLVMELIPSVSQGAVDMIAILACFFVFVIYLFSFGKERASLFLGTHFLDHMLWGIALWFLAYPFVLSVGQLAAFFLFLFDPNALLIQQIAVKHLQDSSASPYLFYMLIFGVIILVPFVEELLFRGFLQNYLKKRWGTKFAIIFTSLIFASFHYAPSQEMKNVEFLPALFTLSCFLGFAYEKRGSLFASYGLHAFFNAFSIFLLIVGAT